MQTFLIERRIPPLFDISDPDQVALHCRWATDAYREVDASWYGSIVTSDRMLGLAAADGAGALERYRDLLSIPASDITVRQVVRFLGPAFAMPRDDPRFRPQRLAPASS